MVETYTSFRASNEGSPRVVMLNVVASRSAGQADELRELDSERLESLDAE